MHPLGAMNVNVLNLWESMQWFINMDQSAKNPLQDPNEVRISNKKRALMIETVVHSPKSRNHITLKARQQS